MFSLIAYSLCRMGGRSFSPSNWRYQEQPANTTAGSSTSPAPEAPREHARDQLSVQLKGHHSHRCCDPLHPRALERPGTDQQPQLAYPGYGRHAVEHQHMPRADGSTHRTQTHARYQRFRPAGVDTQNVHSLLTTSQCQSLSNHAARRVTRLAPRCTQRQATRGRRKPSQQCPYGFLLRMHEIFRQRHAT